MKNWLPWVHYPGVTKDRLNIVADELIDARNGAASDHKPETGESSWSVGVRGYERSEVRLIRPQVTYDWLRAVNGVEAGPSMFVFKMGLHPVRFLHGTPDDIPAKYEKPVLPELEEIKQAQLLDAALRDDRILRLCVETFAHTLLVKRVVLAELNKKTGDVLNEFLIRDFGEAMGGSTAPVVPFAPSSSPAGVVLDPPDVTIKGLKKKKQEDAD